MRLFPAMAVVALASAGAAAPAEVTVRLSGAHVDLTATAAPLADVLDRLARQTGMKVVYEGPVPRQIVTLSLHGRTPTETVLSVLEGLGVNFALVSDPSGARVQTLVIAGTATASSSPSSAAAARSLSSPGARRPPGRPPETVDPAWEELDEDPAPDEEAFSGLAPGEVADPAAPPVPDPTLANPAAPGPSVPPPGGIPAPPTSAFSPSPFAPQPQPFPPLPPGVPAAPGESPPPEESATPAAPPP